MDIPEENDQDLSSLQDRRMAASLTFFDKVPLITPNAFQNARYMQIFFYLYSYCITHSRGLRAGAHLWGVSRKKLAKWRLILIYIGPVVKRVITGRLVVDWSGWLGGLNHRHTMYIMPLSFSQICQCCSVATARVLSDLHVLNQACHLQKWYTKKTKKSRSTTQFFNGPPINQ